jgi:serine/threonine protein kinase
MGAYKRIYYGIYRIIKPKITNLTSFTCFDLKTNLEITDEPVAIHEISKNDIDRLLNELEIYFKLDHENILKPYHIKNTDDKLYMYSQIGKNVFDVTMDNIKNFIKQMLSGLSYLHSQKPPIIHRDFKLGNIIKIGNTYKIIDFGLSTKFFPQVAPLQQTQEEEEEKEAPAQHTLERQTSVTKEDDTFTEGLGTLHYMAPEITRVEDVEYSKKTDTYALGITIINIIRKIKGLKQIYVGVDYQTHIFSIYDNKDLEDEEKKQTILNAEFYKLICTGNLLIEQIPSQPTFIDNIVPEELKNFLTDCLLNPENRLTPTELLETYQEFLSN